MEIFLVIAAIVVAVLIYFAGIQRQKINRENDKKESRICRVADTYINLVRADKNAGLGGLIEAGIAGLDNESEIKTVRSKIIEKNEKDPFGRYAELLEQVDLLLFFKSALGKGLENYSPEQIIEELNDKAQK